MKLEDYTTPLTDALEKTPGSIIGTINQRCDAAFNLARDLERKLRQAEYALVAQFHGKYGVLYQADIAARLSAELAESNHKLALCRDALVSIKEYWNGSVNERAMRGACEHNESTAADALEQTEPTP